MSLVTVKSVRIKNKQWHGSCETVLYSEDPMAWLGEVVTPVYLLFVGLIRARRLNKHRLNVMGLQKWSLALGYVVNYW